VSAMAEERDARPSYRHTVYSGLTHDDEAPALAPDEAREVEERLREISEARAEAAVHGRDYLIH